MTPNQHQERDSFKLNYYKADLTKMVTLFRQEDWEDTFSNKSMNDKWGTFLEIYNKRVRACVPFNKNKQELNKPKWMKTRLQIQKY